MRSFLLLLVAVTYFAGLPAGAQPIPEDLSVQLQLVDSAGDPLDGSVVIAWSIYDVVSAGSPLLGSVATPVPVDNGVADIKIGGSLLAGLPFDRPYWIQFVVDGETLTPRTPFGAVPYALGLRGIRMDALNDDVHPANVLIGQGHTVYEDATFGVDGASVGGGFKNTVKAFYAVIGGGRDNVIGRYSGTDLFFGDYGTIGGGRENEIGADQATIGGGAQNQATGSNSTVAGGASNTAGGNQSTVAGGVDNAASGEYATVGGGSDNVAGGWLATSPGGFANQAAGAFAFAAGRGAAALHDGSFVWSDTSRGCPFDFTDPPPCDRFASTAPNQFLVSAEGGVGIGTPRPAGRVSLSRSAQTAADQLELRTEGSITVGNRDGIRFTQTLSPEAAPIDLAWIRIPFRSFGGADMALGLRYQGSSVLYLKNFSGGGTARVGILTEDPVSALDVNGKVTVTDFENVSDGRLKRDIRPISNPLETVQALRGVNYEWDHAAYPDRNFDSGRQLGLVAQEVLKVLPDVVSRDEKGFYAVAYTELIPLLIESIKELQGMVEAQQHEIDLLKRAGMSE